MIFDMNCPALRKSTTTSSTKSQSPNPLTTSRPPRNASASMHGPHNVSTSHQDDQRLSAVATDMKQELHGGICASVQHDTPPTIITDHQGAETSKPDQGEHEKEEIRDIKRIRYLEAKLAKEIDISKRLEAMLANRERVLQEKEAELTSVKDLAYHQEQKIRELSATNQMHSDEIKQVRDELRHVKTKYQQTNQLLQERSEELSTAQQFLGKADSMSPTEVLRLVETLNAEIAHQSNFITFWGLRDLLGPWLYDNLWHRMKDPNLHYDDLLTQLTLQMGLTNACKSIINHWDPPFWNDGEIFDRVYGDMGRKVGQVVAGKWRALSSTHLGVDHNANKEYLRGILLKLIIAVSGSVQSENSLPPDLMTKVDDITRKTLDIHKHVRSSFTSMDLEVYSIPCGTPFDASQMEDADGPNAGGKGKAENDNRRDKVICTREMGLRCRKRVTSGKQGEVRDETGVILKSKVVLVDAVETLKL
ncbi:hypothetical protein M378DRAFT_26470 [Amanita muscaria Koide BX008]|uniref:Uncharacterized protein n=1 Tax=Amanita muscaria (strain Koide BX008) TaxID=946122 RepID=A0A0C2WW91_AMAMK|nr:hypothetical protein M378DRAFT_26470 [Amanita muscaria Koide BX008]